MRNSLVSGLTFVGRGPVLYPFLFAIYPIIFLWAQNIEEFSQFTEPLEVIYPLLISLGSSAVAVLVARLVLRHQRKAGLIVFLLVLAFFSYGHIYELILSHSVLDFLRQRQFLIIWASIFGITTLLALRIRSDLVGTTNYLNGISVILLAISFVSIIAYWAGGGSDTPNRVNANGAEHKTSALDLSSLPDVFYIVPDAFPSPKNLKIQHGEDISNFTGFLRERGFVVADNARPNYSNTKASLGSSLNMTHINYLSEVMPPGSTDGTTLANLIKDSTVMEFFRDIGYQVIHTDDSWFSEAKGDLLLGCSASGFLNFHADDFTGALISTTVLSPILKFFGLAGSQLQALRLCEISKIIEADLVDGPKFVFSHLWVPHPPFIFGRDGEDVSGSISTTDYSLTDRYVDQVVFISKKLQEVVDILLTRGNDQTVIIIQSDHGSSHSGEGFEETIYRERMGILNAYYLPDGGNERWYDSITPVNTFRVIFNQYFGTELDLLPDTSYYTNTLQGAYNFLDVTEILDAADKH